MYGSTPSPGENGPTFLDFPLFLGILQWDEPTKRVPFTAEPEIPEILTKWKAPTIIAFGWRHLAWETSENMGCDLWKRNFSNVVTLFS